MARRRSARNRAALLQRLNHRMRSLHNSCLCSWQIHKAIERMAGNWTTQSPVSSQHHLSLSLSSMRPLNESCQPTQTILQQPSDRWSSLRSLPNISLKSRQRPCSRRNVTGPPLHQKLQTWSHYTQTKWLRRSFLHNTKSQSSKSSTVVRETPRTCHSFPQFYGEVCKGSRTFSLRIL